MPPRVFIASSSEALQVAEAVNIRLDAEAQVTQWDNAFDLSSMTLPSLVAHARNTDFAVLIFHKDDQAIIRGNSYSIVRDNVLFELGLFIGAVGIECCFVLIPKSSEKNFRLPSDLDGLTVATYDDSHSNLLDAVTASCGRIKLAMRRLYREKDPAPALNNSFSCVPHLYDQTDQGLFSGAVYDLLNSAKKVTMIGTGLCILSQDPIRKMLFERAKAKNCHVNIYLGNPYSPDLQNRLIEEELGEWVPSVGFEGLVKRAEMLLQEKKRLGDPAQISLFMFNHYPTMAIIQIDNHYFMYPYGYATLGNFSPVIHYSGNDSACGALIQYLDRQIELIAQSATPMDMVLRSTHLAPSGLQITDVIPLAVYFIPPSDSSLYKFGINTIGYDVYHGGSAQQKLDFAPISEAGLYGFHVTICDVVYFLTQAEIRRIREEIRFVAKSFRAFELTGLRLEKNFPAPGTISIMVEDPSGSLEALHHEFVCRIHRRSYASNYSLKSSNRALGPFSDRDRLMIEKYHAPHILGRFQPHFTLVSDLSPEDVENVYDKLFAEMQRLQVPDHIEVNALAIVGKAEDGKHYIVNEPLIHLKS